MVFFQVLDFPLLINQFAFLILKWLFGNDPIVVKSLSFLLEIGQKLLLLFKICIKSSQLLTQVESVLLWFSVLDFLCLVHSLLLEFYISLSIYLIGQVLAGLGVLLEALFSCFIFFYVLYSIRTKKLYLLFYYSNGFKKILLSGILFPSECKKLLIRMN